MGSAMHIPRAQVSWLRKAGFLVVAPEYRLCPHVDVWTGPVQDCVHLYNWVVSGGLQDGLRHFGITADIDRISLLGHSVGATLAMIVVSPGNDSPDLRVIQLRNDQRLFCRFIRACNSRPLGQDRKVNYGRCQISRTVSSYLRMHTNCQIQILTLRNIPTGRSIGEWMHILLVLAITSRTPKMVHCGTSYYPVNPVVGLIRTSIARMCRHLLFTGHRIITSHSAYLEICL